MLGVSGDGAESAGHNETVAYPVLTAVSQPPSSHYWVLQQRRICTWQRSVDALLSRQLLARFRLFVCPLINWLKGGWMEELVGERGPGGREE